ncbi:uncharacterized protein LOC107365405 [Tetranychus urticae]|uniref:uncharacterized protein LOC107365405 n=1 Tax=Tetranychus urticae TaxID=32264 RepID=UPI000D655063|nr:uncharacterized protein LOC107365405 [Tetranychus urticae]
MKSFKMLINHLFIWIISIINSILFKGIDCLRISKFYVPTILSSGDSTEFICNYELDGDSLYSLKWYKNESEFYRYEPNNKNKIQIFPLQEIPFEVSKSVGGTTLVISRVVPETSGKYKCELSADGSFLTVQKEQMLIVTDGTTSLTSNIVFYLVITIGFFGDFQTI